MHLDGSILDTDGRIDPHLWAAAVGEEIPVGTCHCDLPVVALPVEVFFGRRSYPAECLAGHEAAVPGTRVVREPTTLVAAGLGEAPGALEAAREREARMLGERVAA